jgi:hypothetical protein
MSSIIRDGDTFHSISVFGRGVFKDKYGMTYAGQCKDGHACGLGVATWPSGSKVYAEHGPDGQFDGRRLRRDAYGGTGYRLFQRGKENASTPHAVAGGRAATQPNSSHTAKHVRWAVLGPLRQREHRSTTGTSAASGKEYAYVSADGRCTYNYVACAPDDPRLLALIAQLAPVEVRPAARAPHPPIARHSPPSNRPARFVAAGTGGRRGHRGAHPFSCRR